MAENGSTAPGMASGNTHTGSGSNGTRSTGGGNDGVLGGGGDDRIAGDGPLVGQWTYSVCTSDFVWTNQTGTIPLGAPRGTGLTTRTGEPSCDDSASLSRVLSAIGG